MSAAQFFTIADGLNGYPKTKQALQKETSEDLMREYLTGMKHCFNNMFGRQACQFQNLVASVLLEREVTTIPNLFGDIKIVNTWK